MMCIPAWALAAISAVGVAAWWLRSVHERNLDLEMRYRWSGLPRWRKDEILYLRARAHLGGPTGVEDFSRRSDAEIEQFFENSIQNAQTGDRWALDFLREQVFLHHIGARAKSTA
jgi:hypothetical protein